MRKKEKEIMAASEDEHKKRLDRCIPVARKVLTIIADNESYLGDVVDAKTGQPKPEANEKYIEIAKEIFDVMFDENCYLTDREFIFQLALQAISLTKEKVINSLDRSVEKAEAILFGKDVMDLRMADVDYILKNPKC